MGTSKKADVLTLALTVVLSVVGGVRTAKGIPVDSAIGKNEAGCVCLQCEVVQNDAG